MAANETLCPAAQVLFDEHASIDSNGNTTINETNLSALVVEMVFNRFIEGCQLPKVAAAKCVTNKAEAWVWATLAAMIITIASLCGVVFLPIKSAHSQQPLMHILLGLSSGALIGDAVLHLIPHVLEPAFEQTEEDHHIRTLRYLLLCILSMVLSFLLEKGFRFWSDHRKKAGLDKKPAKPVDQEHLHAGEDEKCDEESHGEAGGHHHHHQHHGHGHGLGHVHHIQAFGWINLVSDAIHNFFDGVAIGVAFQTSPSVGISTTLAVFFHEIPQELGDYALLIRAGFSRKQALLFNLFCGSTAIVGMFVGCGIGSLELAEPWILSFVAGMFLYVGLADIVPELNHTGNIKASLFQIGGLLAGFTITAGLVLAELQLEKNSGC